MPRSEIVESFMPGRGREVVIRVDSLAEARAILNAYEAMKKLDALAKKEPVIIRCGCGCSIDTQGKTQRAKSLVSAILKDEIC